jgi:hypothetical protein
MSSDKLIIEYAKKRVGDGPYSSPYAFAFGLVWTSLSKAKQQELIEYAERKLAEIQAEEESN